ncbi:HTH-type transcriptional regulator PuuR [Enhygromyxa salina]|uniref:HTH-type transcriptional regulator PuuR n=1 Tax=Enhygromyxa salina TaxID=215803 RepID=A0A2S9YBF7_9BACT|nr:helix-turn-helix domain-containing protein [Enhygromyxa salina]PRQ02458.1 HTH-type transcriptional regulator PuuR [Enhygromyxa salina]
MNLDALLRYSVRVLGMTDPSSAIGPNIRRRRQTLGLSLDAMAAASGVSSTMLSEVERGKKNPTVKLAYQIALALGCSLTELLEDAPPTPVAVVRADERQVLVDPSSGVARHGLRPGLLDRHLEIAWYELPAGESTGEVGAKLPGVVEFLTVLEGRVEVWLGGVAHELRAGDSISYGLQTTIEYRNSGGARCRVLLIVDRSKVGASG